MLSESGSKLSQKGSTAVMMSMSIDDFRDLPAPPRIILLPWRSTPALSCRSSGFYTATNSEPVIR